MPDNNLFDIKKRIHAAQQTRKITRTMELIASSRLQRGKAALVHCREWLQHMREAARRLPPSRFGPEDDGQMGEKRAYIVFGGSKGLSGAYAPNLLQYAQPLVRGQIVLDVGSATKAFFPDAHSYFGDEAPSMEFAATIVREAKSLWENEEADAVYMIYTRGATHVLDRLFPLVPMEECGGEVIVEPSAQLLYPAIFTKYAVSVVYETHLQAFVSEQVARVSAMDSATRNAEEIIEALQTNYNRIRQSSITQEIIAVSNAVRGD